MLFLSQGLGGGSSDPQLKRGVAYLFLIFAGISLACLFLRLVVPETKAHIIVRCSSGRDILFDSDLHHRSDTDQVVVQHPQLRRAGFSVLV